MHTHTHTHTVHASPAENQGWVNFDPYNFLHLHFFNIFHWSNYESENVNIENGNNGENICTFLQDFKQN